VLGGTRGTRGTGGSDDAGDGQWAIVQRASAWRGRWVGAGAWDGLEGGGRRLEAASGGWWDDAGVGGHR
jgi:hypothetical protein